MKKFKDNCNECPNIANCDDEGLLETGCNILTGDIEKRLTSDHECPMAFATVDHEPKVGWCSIPAKTDCATFIAGYAAAIRAGVSHVTNVKSIIRNGPATIVLWEDGTKTIVKKSADSPDDQYSAFCAALARKVYGSNHKIHKMVERKTKVQEKKR